MFTAPIRKLFTARPTSYGLLMLQCILVGSFHLACGLLGLGVFITVVAFTQSWLIALPLFALCTLHWGFHHYKWLKFYAPDEAVELRSAYLRLLHTLASS